MAHLTIGTLPPGWCGTRAAPIEGFGDDPEVDAAEERGAVLIVAGCLALIGGAAYVTQKLVVEHAR